LFCGSGSDNNGAYEGGVIVEGENQTGEPTDVTITATEE